MIRRYLRAAQLCGQLLMLAACASPPARYYGLQVRMARPPLEPMVAAQVVVLEPVEVSAAVDRPMLVTRLGPGRYHLEEQERWIEPLPDAIERVLRADLRALAPQLSVLDSGRAGTAQAARLAVTIDVLDGAPGGYARLAARVQLNDAAGRPRLVSVDWRSTGAVADYPSLVAAYSDGIAVLAATIASAVDAQRQEVPRR